MGEIATVSDEAAPLEVKRVDLVGAQDHFEGKLEDRDLPGVVHALDHGAARDCRCGGCPRARARGRRPCVSWMISSCTSPRRN